MPEDEEGGYKTGITPLLQSVPDRAKELHDRDEPEDFTLEGVEEEDENPTEEVKAAEEEVTKKKKIFRPLVFAPRHSIAAGHGNHGSDEGAANEHHPQTGLRISASDIDALNAQLHENILAIKEGKAQIEAMQTHVMVNPSKYSSIIQQNEQMMDAFKKLQEGQDRLQIKLEKDGMAKGIPEEGEELDVKSNIEDGDNPFKDGTGSDSSSSDDNIQSDSDIIRATRKDWIITGILFCLMATLTGVVSGWDTHMEENHTIFGPVGLACETPCLGDPEEKDFFHGHNTFGHGEIIQLVAYIDAAPSSEEHHEETVPDNEYNNEVRVINNTNNRILSSGGGCDEDHYTPSKLKVMIRGIESNITKWSNEEEKPWESSRCERKMFTSKVNTDSFPNPTEMHVIDIYSSTSTSLSFTMRAEVLTALAEYSVIIAAVIMFVVYFFILLETIHRTLVAIFGSLLALFFLFLMKGGVTEPVHVIMLHMEWSTIGLLFGMMLIVGELSHTGIFEWCAVRLLVMSKGSLNRLIVLLMLLTAVSSAFLDNVTTMLLVAPVTIDMCNILNVDPRPYLIGEVLLSNVGGTATLIGKVGQFLCVTVVYIIL